MDKSEQIIHDAIIAARTVQEFLWNKDSLLNYKKFPFDIWVQVFQKRVDKIAAIRSHNPSALVELRKRLLQQAALSICAMESIDKILEEL